MSPWGDQIIEAFLNVLRRPKFNIQVKLLCDFGKVGLGKEFLVEYRDDKIKLYTSEFKTMLTIRAESEDEKFHFTVKFHKYPTENVRKKALIFVKKLEMKSTFDVFES